MKRFWVALCAAFLLLFGVAANAESADNLLSNGGFERLNAAGEPLEWYAAAYRTQAGYSRIAVTDEKAHSGKYSAMVENATANDARYTCTVPVEPNSLYRLSGYVLVDTMNGIGNGANFAVEDIYSFSDCLFDTEGEWRYLEWYGETGESQTELTFGVRVGGYGAESVGRAYFDDIALEKVEQIPKEVIASVWYAAKTEPAAAPVATSDEGKKSTSLFLIIAAVFGLLYLCFRPVLNSSNEKPALVCFAVLMLLAILARIVLAMCVPGYSVDINCFTAWSLRMVEKGPSGFYQADYFCDYPPGYMLLLWPCGLLLQAVGLANTQAALLIVKLLPLICDILGSLWLFRFCKRRIGTAGAALVALLYALNPVVLINGAAWGQADSVLALMLALTACFAMERRWSLAIPFFATAALLKPQALLFAPIGGAWLVLSLVTNKAERRQQWKRLGIGLLAAAVVAAAVILPFNGQQEPGWLIRLYRDTLGSYAYATVNAANLYYLLGANWTGLETLIPTALAVGTALLFGCMAALGHWGKRFSAVASVPSLKRRALSILMAAEALAQLVLAFLPATYNLYGYAMMAFAFLFSILCMIYDRRAECLPFYMALSLLMIFVLGIKVHERYLFPAILLLLIGYALTRDRRLLTLCVGFSITTFVNTAIVLDNSILFGAEKGHLNPDTQVVNILLCALNLCLCLYALYIAWTGLRQTQAEENAPEAFVPASYEAMLFRPGDPQLHLGPRDYAIMGGTALLYAVLAFTNLGSTTAPQTGWVSTSADEQVVFDLGGQETFSVLYYAGVSYYDFSVSVSDDGIHWSEASPLKMREGRCYRWQYGVNAQTVDGKVVYADSAPQNIKWFTGRYLRLNAESAGLNLWEIVARNEAGENLPITVVSHTGANENILKEPQPVENLIDEQDTCVGEPGWYNGTYFDEIYHARTGYEHLHGIKPYETTHPPLGKLMMSVGIAIFGMTPFGWRFAGALIGVLMLPALYLLAMQLTHKRSIAVLSMAAFALDLMHYTQTRIATIDSFPVFFILLSYLFMVRYMQTDVFETVAGQAPRLFDKPFRKSLIPLLLSGIFMGLGIASKWIGIYSAAGLAVLFFITIYRQYRVSNVACGLSAGENGRPEQEEARLLCAQTLTLKRILITCGFCVIFFILIPCVIYYLCYIPYLLPTGPVTLKRVISAQQSMLDYHSTPGLGMDHFFQSPWWQWPFILKAMWFACDSYEPAGYASTIMCMGNPWVFYIGAVAMLGVLFACAAKYVRVRERVMLKQGDGDLTLLVLTIGFLAQYLPWMLVPRSMYIYHYFASVPFIILSTAWWLDRIPKSRPKWRYGVMIAYLIGAAIFFVMFFPYASGWLTSINWLNALKWFPGLYY